MSPSLAAALAVAAIVIILAVVGLLSRWLGRRRERAGSQLPGAVLEEIARRRPGDGPQP